MTATTQGSLETSDRVWDPAAKTVVKRIIDDALAKAADDARREEQARASARQRVERANARARYCGD